MNDGRYQFSCFSCLLTHCYTNLTGALELNFLDVILIGKNSPVCIGPVFAYCVPRCKALQNTTTTSQEKNRFLRYLITKFTSVEILGEKSTVKNSIEQQGEHIKIVSKKCK